MTIKRPALILDRNSASGFRVEYLSAEVDPELVKVLTVDEVKEARQMMRLAEKIRQSDLEGLAQLVWSDKERILRALNTTASLLTGNAS